MKSSEVRWGQIGVLKNKLGHASYVGHGVVGQAGLYTGGGARSGVEFSVLIHWFIVLLGKLDCEWVVVHGVGWNFQLVLCK